MNTIENQFDLIEIELDESSAEPPLPIPPVLPSQQTGSHSTLNGIQERIDHKLYKEPPAPRKYIFL
jgi:hypothetical protein